MCGHGIPNSALNFRISDIGSDERHAFCPDAGLERAAMVRLDERRQGH
jgi:hypothetical protein